MDEPVLAFTRVDSPVGRLLLAGDGRRLHYISFPAGSRAFGPKPHWVRDDSAFDEARRQLAAYFAGELRRFDLSLHAAGTAFQRRVWAALPSIPYGETRTYGWLAGHLGSSAASRAVGAANGANPLPIVLPCHRVIGAGGELTGFGGGLPTKRFLLALESAAATGGPPPVPLV
ncbi:MAG: methylated-DNA--[protein]-cysteine S-methyltransferase [Hyphomicrobiales bacterium]|nr:methylated-DNA--[protein]-cysteine S-methyltransferase [Hyphomicrobiales bacterium]